MIVIYKIILYIELYYRAARSVRLFFHLGCFMHAGLLALKKKHAAKRARSDLLNLNRNSNGAARSERHM